MTEAQSIRMLEAMELAAQSLRNLAQTAYVQAEMLTKIHGLLLVRNSEPAEPVRKSEPLEGKP